MTKHVKRKRSLSAVASPSTVSVAASGLRHGSFKISVLTEMSYRIGPSHRRRSATAFASGPNPAINKFMERKKPEPFLKLRENKESLGGI